MSSVVVVELEVVVEVVLGRVDVDELELLEVLVELLVDVVVDVVVGRDVDVLELLEVLVVLLVDVVVEVDDVVEGGVVVVVAQLGVLAATHALLPESFPALSTAETA